MRNPFLAMAEKYPHEARALAICVTSSGEPSDIWACCRAERRLVMRAVSLAAFFDGALFAEFRASVGANEWADAESWLQGDAFGELRELAWSYLENNGLS